MALSITLKGIHLFFEVTHGKSNSLALQLVYSSTSSYSIVQTRKVRTHYLRMTHNLVSNKEDELISELSDFPNEYLLHEQVKTSQHQYLEYGSLQLFWTDGTGSNPQFRNSLHHPPNTIAFISLPTNPRFTPSQRNTNTRAFSAPLHFPHLLSRPFRH